MKKETISFGELKDFSEVKRYLENSLHIFLEKWSLKPEKIVVEQTSKEHEGDFSIVIFSFAKKIGLSLSEFSSECCEFLEKQKEIKKVIPVGGFLNVLFQDDFYWKFLKKSNSFFQKKIEKTKKIYLVEYSSPNTNKPLHLGHLRNNFLGQSIVKILNFAGHSTFSTCVVNDRGIHICKSMVAYKNFSNGESPTSSGLKGDFFVGKYYVLFEKIFREQIEILKKNFSEEESVQKAPIMIEAKELLQKWEQGNQEVLELWKKMNSWVYQGFEKTYQKIGVTFDKIYYESQTYLLGKKIIEEGLGKKKFYKNSDNSIWIDLEEKNLDKKNLQRADGTSVYITQDIAMAYLRQQEFSFDSLIYVVGNEQEYHFKVLFEILKKMKAPFSERLYHLSYGMVELPSGKMKSRQGTVVDADNLIEDIENLVEEQAKNIGKTDLLPLQISSLALSALKYQILKISPEQKILFDPKEAIDLQGNSGIFIQYTHARINSLLKKNKTNFEENFSTEINPEEKKVIVSLMNFFEFIYKAEQALAPNLIANSLFDLCKNYNRFYAFCPILTEIEEKKSFRIYLSQIVLESLSLGLQLLDIVPMETV